MAIATGTAIALGVGAGLKAYGSHKQAKASEKATNAQQDAIRRSEALQREQFQRSQGLFDPYLQVGNSANALMGRLTMPGGGAAMLPAAPPPGGQGTPQLTAPPAQPQAPPQNMGSVMERLGSMGGAFTGRGQAPAHGGAPMPKGEPMPAAGDAQYMTSSPALPPWQLQPSRMAPPPVSGGGMPPTMGDQMARLMPYQPMAGGQRGFDPRNQAMPQTYRSA